MQETPANEFDGLESFYLMFYLTGYSNASSGLPIPH
jgi:hypothetical protein